MKAAELTYELDIKNPVNGFNLPKGSYYEGDILLSAGQRLDAFLNYITGSSGLLWLNGRVPYLLESSFNNDERKKIASAFVFFNQNTCIRWIRKQDNERNWISITRRENGCFSGLGFRRVNGEYVLNLGEGCFSLQTIIHEMMHRIGFIHEQARPDRDLYVEIIKENIEDGREHNFILKPKYFDDKYLSLPYDIHSVMHYEESDFSKNGDITIKAKNSKRLGCSQFGMKCPTDLDIEKINVVYNCSKKSKKREVKDPRALYVGSVNLKSFYTLDIRTSWAGSMDLCHFLGMRMATVKSEGENDLLRQFLQSGILKQISYFWLSGTDHITEGEWYWLFTKEKISYTNWKFGHPPTSWMLEDRSWNCHSINRFGYWQLGNCGDLEPHRWALGPLCEM